MLDPGLLGEDPVRVTDHSTPTSNPLVTILRRVDQIFSYCQDWFML